MKRYEIKYRLDLTTSATSKKEALLNLYSAINEPVEKKSDEVKKIKVKISVLPF